MQVFRIFNRFKLAWGVMVVRHFCSPYFCSNSLALSGRRSASYGNQSIDLHSESIDLHSKSMHWFLYDRDLRHERVASWMNCVFCCGRKWKDYLLEMRLVLISNYSATVNTNKNYTNLIYVNQLKKQIYRSIIIVIQNRRTQ